MPIIDFNKEPKLTLIDFIFLPITLSVFFIIAGCVFIMDLLSADSYIEEITDKLIEERTNNKN